MKALLGFNGSEACFIFLCKHFLIMKMCFSVGEPDSRVLAHIGDDDITIRINTDGAEYNIEVNLR